MKIACDVLTLKDALQNVQRAVAGKSTIEVLEGVLIKAKSQNEILVCGYNLEIGITKMVPAKIEMPSSFVIDAKIIVDILRKSASNEVLIDFNEKTLDVLVVSGESKFYIKALRGEDFPSLPSVEDGESIELEMHSLKKMVRQTIFAASSTDENPISMGALFNIEEGVLTLVCVDGFRLSKTCLHLNLKEDFKANFVVPAKSLAELVRLMPEEKESGSSKEEERDNTENKTSEKINEENSSTTSERVESVAVTVVFGKKHIIFNVAGYSVISRLLEGNFLDYKSAIPKTSLYKIEANTREFIDSIERVSILINERTKSPVRLKFTEGLINFYCNSPLGVSEDKLCVDFKGESFEIGLNSKYILDALKNTDTDVVNLEFSGPLAPVKVTSLQGDSFVFLVLPVRLVAE